jgi:N-methyl-L-proline demethylase
VGQDVTGTIYPDYLQALYRAGVTFTPDHLLVSVSKESGELVATLRNAFSDETSQRRVDQVVVEHGTTQVDELYHELLSGSSNLGELDLDAFVAGGQQRSTRNPDGHYQLFRIGDAVAHRNVHAAIYDARRLCMNM